MTVRNYISQWIRRDPLKYHGLHADLISARFGTTLENYIWRSIRMSFLVGALFAIIGYFASSFLTFQIGTGKTGIYNVFNVQLPAMNIGIPPGILAQAAAVFVSFVVGTYIGYLLLLRYPAIEKRNRAIKINLALHNAVAWSLWG